MSPVSMNHTKKRKNIPVDGDLHERAAVVARAMGGVNLQFIADMAFGAWLDANEAALIKKAGRKNGNSRNR